MKERLIKIGKWVGYPLFYIFCLLFFGYLTFPFDLLKDRIVAEFEKQSKGQRLEIAKLDSYWFSGVELEGVKIVMPPESSSPSAPAGFPGMPSEPTPQKDAVVYIDEAHARVRLLPLLIGRVRLNFWASAFGGEIEGTAPLGKDGGEIDVELKDVDISKIEPLAQSLGMPIRGTATGKLSLDAPEGKYDKMNGSLELTVNDIVVGDGKTKIQGLIALPAARVGTLAITAEAKDGQMKISKLDAKGADLELVGDGKLTLREPWNASISDMFLRFKFTDAYRGKNDITKGLLGAPGSKAPSTIELTVPKLKKAKRPDGFYGFHLHGPLRRLKYDPSTADSGSSGAGRPSKKGSDSPFGTINKKSPGFAPPSSVNTMGVGDRGSNEPAAPVRRPSTPEARPAPEPAEALPEPTPEPPPAPPPAAEPEPASASPETGGEQGGPADVEQSAAPQDLPNRGMLRQMPTQ